MDTFLTFIIITILVFWILGKIGRFLLRRWLLKRQEEISRKFSQQFGQDPFGGSAYGAGQQAGRPGQNDGRGAENEGTVRIRQTTARQKKVSGSVGEYVDYEEVEAEQADN